MKQKRRSEIAEYINHRGSVTFMELKERFSDYSEMTLRTDLKELDQEKKIVRFHGGARAIQVPARADDVFFLRTARNLQKRQVIAQKAAQFFQKELANNRNLSLYIDCGVTIEEVCRRFPDEWCTIVTNSISSAYALSALKKPSITLLGGGVNKYNCSCESILNYQVVERMHFDYALIPTAGYDKSVGFTCGKEVLDEIRWTILGQSSKLVLLFDSSKIGLIYPMTHTRDSDIYMVISDDDLPADIRAHFESQGIIVL